MAKDENVRKEAQAEEDVKTVQPMGNEAANVELMEQMLKDANDDISLDLGSSNNIVNENFRSGGSKKGRFPDSSLRIFNDNNIIRNDTGSDISDESGLNIISTSGKPKRSHQKTMRKKR